MNELMTEEQYNNLKQLASHLTDKNFETFIKDAGKEYPQIYSHINWNTSIGGFAAYWGIAGLYANKGYIKFPIVDVLTSDYEQGYLNFHEALDYVFGPKFGAQFYFDADYGDDVPKTLDAVRDAIQARIKEYEDTKAKKYKDSGRKSPGVSINEIDINKVDSTSTDAKEIQLLDQYLDRVWDALSNDAVSVEELLNILEDKPTTSLDNDAPSVVDFYKSDEPVDPSLLNGDQDGPDGPADYPSDDVIDSEEAWEDRPKSQGTDPVNDEGETPYKNPAIDRYDIILQQGTQSMANLTDDDPIPSYSEWCTQFVNPILKESLKTEGNQLCVQLITDGEHAHLGPYYINRALNDYTAAGYNVYVNAAATRLIFIF